MTGERISEALELADREIEVFHTYEKAKEGLSEEQLAAIQPPPRNPILVAHNLEPEAWVLRVVEGVQSAALHDALLVLPFSKVMSLMVYLNLWAKRVSTIPTASDRTVSLSPLRSGMFRWSPASCSFSSKHITTRL
jgi:U3 small nucleolar RNA-associated protein 12